MQRHQGPTPAELAHTFGFFASIKTLALSGYNKAGNDHWIRTEDYFSFLFPHSPRPRKLLNTLAIIIHGFAYTRIVTCLLCYLACLLLSKVPVLADSVK